MNDEVKRALAAAGQPTSEPTIEVKPGRWYYGIFFMGLPRGRGFPYGGDLMGCLWREDAEPEIWHMTYRSRHNAGENVSPWEYGEGGDTKRTFKATFHGDEHDAIRATHQAVLEMKKITGVFFSTKSPHLEWVIVRGDSEKFITTVTTAKPSWMHVKQFPLNKDAP